jgi:hypothetical protein
MPTEFDRWPGLLNQGHVRRAALALGAFVIMVTSNGAASHPSACLPTSGPDGVGKTNTGSVGRAVAAAPCLDRALGCLPSKASTDSLPRPTAAPARSVAVTGKQIEPMQLPDLNTPRSNRGCDAASSPNCRPQQAATKQVADENRTMALAKAVTPTKVNENGLTLPDLNAQKVWAEMLRAH